MYELRATCSTCCCCCSGEAEPLLLVVDIEEVGHGTHTYAELSNRTEANFTDVRLALFDLGTEVMQLVEFQHNAPPISFPRRMSFDQ